MTDRATQIIKQSIAFRAKFRVESKTMSPLLIVPHPKNRGGDPVKSLITMHLNGTIAAEGYDTIEANGNGVAVQEKPAVAGGSGTLFQDDFAQKLKTDPDMLERGEGIVAIAGSLSHSHLNCGMRNILGGKKGCECPEGSKPEEGSKKCQCASCPMLDDNGNYSLAKVEAHDEAWARDCQSGLDWEMLSWKMDEEDPDAAQIISIALNKKNEAAMKTGHLEIMSTLEGLCKPDPTGVVLFEPVRDKLIELYGSAVDHPDFVYAFRLVCDAGGAGSKHMKDLHEFTTVYVNPKLRKMRMEAYATIAPYPIEYPRIKNACLKWAWKQTPSKGWCQLPPNISHRFASASKHNMIDFMMQLEATMLELSKIVSTVVEDRKSKVKWIAEVEINLMTKVFAVPKTEANKSVQEQKTELCKQCAESIATKLVTLWHSPELKNKARPEIPANGNELMNMVAEHMQDPDFETKTTKPTAAKSEVTEKPVLAPKVIRMDEDGRPLSQHETVNTKKKQEVETIPWSTWASAQTKPNANSMAKMLLSLGMATVHDNDTTHPKPIALVRKGGSIQALTTDSLEKGQLVIPLFFKKPSSVVTVGDGTAVHPKAVCAKVSWEQAPTAAEKEAGMEGENIEVMVYVQPELKLPIKGEQGLDWAPSDNVHPFWFIKRTENEKDDDEANADLVYQDLTHVMACSFKPLSSAVAELSPFTQTFSVSVPCIVNTKPIESGAEVVLKWKPQQRKDKRKNEGSEETAFDQLVHNAKKQARAKQKGVKQ